MKRKLTCLVTGVVASAIALAGCSGSSSNGDSKDSSSTTASKEVRVWFMEGSISDEAQKYLVDEYAKQNSGQTLKIEVQPWDNIKSKLQTSLASADQSPDLVEIGSAKDPLIKAGAFAALDDLKKDLDSKNLIPAFLGGGVGEDGKQYSYPLYGGVRGVFYRKDLFEKAGLKPATTLAELKENAIKLQAANPDQTPDFSGIYLAGVDFHALESYMYASGGRYAEKKGDKWVGTMSSPEVQGALKDLQEIFKSGTHYAQDSQAGQKSFQNYFNEGKVGMLIATGNIGNKISKELWDQDKVGVTAIPSKDPNKVGVSYAGGSNIALSKNAQNPEGAKKALKIIFSPEFQKMLAHSGWVPGNLKYASEIAGPFGKISADVMHEAIIGPETVNWGTMYSNNELSNFWARVANGDDPAKISKDFDEVLNKVLNK